jgi:hypothetical protein
MPTNGEPQIPLPDPAKGTNPIPGKPPKSGPTPDGNDKPPQSRKVVAAPAAGGVIGIIGALFGVVCRAD